MQIQLTIEFFQKYLERYIGSDNASLVAERARENHFWARVLAVSLQSRWSSRHVRATENAPHLTRSAVDGQMLLEEALLELDAALVRADDDHVLTRLEVLGQLLQHARPGAALLTERAAHTQIVDLAREALVGFQLLRQFNTLIFHVSLLIRTNFTFSKK